MMIVLGALGTALAVWLALAGATSATVSLVWPVLAPCISRWHPNDRGTFIAAMAIAPVALPTIILAVVLAPGLLGLFAPVFDHCALHPDHPHLCLVHPTALLSAPLSMSLALLAGFAIVLIVRVWRTSHARARPFRTIAALTSQRLSKHVDLIENERPLALTFGLLRPHALVSTGLREALEPAQWLAVVAHENEHARRRDPFRQFVARVSSIAIWPSARRALLSDLALSAEQACDERAAVGPADRITVARTILAVERLLGPSTGIEERVGAGMDGSSVAARVESLLAVPRPRRLHRGLLALCVPSLVVAAARPLHHEIEHALAWALGTG